MRRQLASVFGIVSGLLGTRGRKRTFLFSVPEILSTSILADWASFWAPIQKPDEYVEEKKLGCPAMRILMLSIFDRFVIT